MKAFQKRKGLSGQALGPMAFSAHEILYTRCFDVLLKLFLMGQ